MNKLTAVLLAILCSALFLPPCFAQEVTFSDQIVITTSANYACSVFSADLDGDGDYDVLSASRIDDKIAWYENTNGLGNFGPQQIITIFAFGAYSVFSTDLDGDGDYDVLSASSGDDKIAWYENTDGQGTFGLQQVITTDTNGAKSVFSADLDGDGDYDVLSASEYDSTIAWYENTDGLGSFGPQQIITTSAWEACSVFSADLDGDGDFDVLSASRGDDKIAWYENLDGLGSFGPQQIITTNADMAESVFSADLDGDGDYDVLSASYWDDKVAWYENTDGLGSFGPQQIITTSADGAKSVLSADLDGDGDYDVLSASYSDDKIAWYENTDGLGSFGPQLIITTSANGALSVFSADLDGDGDYDVLSASKNDDKIAWYHNLLVPNVNITITPWNDPTWIGPNGGSFRWDATITNLTDEIIIYDAWTEVILPNQNVYGPLDLYTNLELEGGSVLAVSPLTSLPGYAPNGIYTFIGIVGLYPNAVSEDGFDFAKLPLPGPAAYGGNEGLEGWTTSNWFEDDDAEFGAGVVVPDEFAIEDVYPNPFNPTTTISVALPKAADLQVVVYNIAGQEVAALANGHFAEGYHSFAFDGSGMASGIYFIQATVPGTWSEMRKVVLVR